MKVKIDPGTQLGKVLRLKGKGLPDVNGYNRGDLLVRVDLYVPKEISKEDRKIIEKLKESQAFTPGASEKENFFSRMKNMFE